MNIYIQKKDAILSLINSFESDEKLEFSLKKFWILTLDTIKPLSFDRANPDNAERNLLKSFESICANIEIQSGVNPKNKTVFEFYSIIEYLSQKNQAQKK